MCFTNNNKKYYIKWTIHDFNQMWKPIFDSHYVLISEKTQTEQKQQY